MPDQTQPALAVGQVWRRGERTRRITGVQRGSEGCINYRTARETHSVCVRWEMEEWCDKATLDAPSEEPRDV